MKKFPWIFLRLVSLSSIQLRVTAESLKVIARVQPSRLSSDGRASITPPPLVQNQYLRERAALATCGYVSGNPGMWHKNLTELPEVILTHQIALPLTCPRDYSCTSTIMIDAAWACCNQIECAGAYQTCINYGDDLCPGLESSECSNIYVSYLSWYVFFMIISFTASNTNHGSTALRLHRLVEHTLVLEALTIQIYAIPGLVAQGAIIF